MISTWSSPTPSAEFTRDRSADAEDMRPRNCGGRRSPSGKIAHELLWAIHGRPESPWSTFSGSQINVRPENPWLIFRDGDAKIKETTAASLTQLEGTVFAENPEFHGKYSPFVGSEGRRSPPADCPSPDHKGHPLRGVERGLFEKPGESDTWRPCLSPASRQGLKCLLGRLLNTVWFRRSFWPSR